MTANLTPEQLREIADSIASRGCVMERGPLAEFFRAHADALEELAWAQSALAEAERKIERLTWYADEFVRLEARGTYGEFRDTVAAYRAELEE